MTNKLEEQFFDAFGIEPSNMCKYAKYGYEGTEGIWYFCNKRQKECWTYPSDTGCKDKMTSYPPITDCILLELICVHNQYSHPFNIYGEKREFLKNDILECMINMLDYFYEHEMGEYSKLKHQVQELFKEEG